MNNLSIKDIKIDPLLNITQKIKSTKCNIFIFGKPGSGKSTILRLLLDDATIALTPSNSSSSIIGGETIRGFLNRAKADHKNLIAQITKAETLLIDDIAGISNFEIDCLSDLMHKYHPNNHHKPFSGLRVIIACDPYQYDFFTWTGQNTKSYFFRAKAFIESEFEVIRLNHSYRYQDVALEEILEKVTTSSLTESDLKLLNTRVLSNFQKTPTVPIITNLQKSKLITEHELFKSGEKMYCSRAKKSKIFSWNPAYTDLRFKKSSPILPIGNITNHLPNGTIYNIDTIQENSDSTFTINILLNGQIIKIENFTWKNGQNSFEQLPIQIVYSLSYLECHGQTLEKALIDIQSRRQPLYTLLSRVKSLDGLFLTNSVSTENFPYDHILNDFIENYDGSSSFFHHKESELKVAIFSDLHLEYNNQFKLKTVDADLLIFAGDICSLDPKYYNYISEKIFEPWGSSKPIVYVFGNHEYYSNNTMYHLEKNFREWLGIYHKNVHVLCNESVNICGIEIFGGTMWTDFESSNKSAMFSASRALSDFTVIQYEKNKKLTPEDTVKMHDDFSSSLRIWAENTKHPKVVVTHHSPIPENYDKDPISPAFHASDMMDIILKHEPLLWIYGHTHNNSSKKVKNTTILCNQHGYPSKDDTNSCQNFDEYGKIFKIKK